MALSQLGIPKVILPQLRNIPRDIFGAFENVDPGALPAVTRYNLGVSDSGIGLDFFIINDAAAAGNATITIDKSKVITLTPGQAFVRDNALFAMIEVSRAGAGAIIISIYYSGVSFEVIDILGAK